MDLARTIAGRNRSGAACRLALSLLAFVAVRSALADDPLDDYRLAVGFYNKEQWKLAAESFQSFLKNHGQHARAENARFYYGLALVKLDEFKQAREVLRNFVRDYPKSRDAPAAAYWIGHASYFLDDFAQAEAELGRFVSAAPQDALAEWALPYLADSELRLKKPEAALKHFQQALDAFPKGEMAEDARFGLARCYELLKKTPEAIRAYQEIAASRTSGRAAEAQLCLGGLQYEGGNYAAAAAAFQAVEQQFPESPQLPQAQLNLGFSLYQLHDYQKAAAQFDKAAKTEKYAAEAALWKGLSLKSLGDFPQAIAALQPAYEKFRDQPIADKLLFQWAVCEDRRGERDRSRALFVEVADRWPKGSLADESLHAACLAAVETGKLPEAEALVARFDRDYPGNRLRLRQEVLKGRVLAAKNDFAGAAKIYQGVIAATEIESTRQQARFYLGYALQNLKQHAQVLEATEPLVARIPAEKALVDYSGVYVLRGVSQLELAKATARTKAGEESPELRKLCAAAVESARRYRETAPNGALSARALAIAAIAEALDRKKNEAVASLAALRKSHSQSAELGEALNELGAIAFSKGDYELAEKLFGELAGWPKESRFHSQALADLGWSQHKQRKFADAAASFARVLAEHPDDVLVPEAAFQRGVSLEDAGKFPEAQAAFAQAWKLPGDSREVFLAGWRSARLLGRMKKTAEADSTFDELFKRFPKPADGDKVLSEWAGIQYDAENSARGDEILRRLVADYPASNLSDDALFSLAESDFLAGKLDKARTQFTAIANSSGADAAVQQKALYQLMRLEADAGQWAALRRVCDDLMNRFPEGTYRQEAELRRAEADFNLADFKAAQERLLALKARKDDPAFKTAPWFPRVWVMLAETQWRVKQYDAVVATVAEYRAWDPQSPLLYQADEIAGRSLKSQAKWAEARAAFERVLKDPRGKQSETAAKSQFLLADTYFWEKSYPTAIREYLKVDILYKYPDLQASALYQAGVCQEELHDWKDAARTYDDVLRRFPNFEHAALARERLEAVRRRLAAR
ncbi:MAG: tetratricopeptide repeat protein [Deltaproteobacteria bacterium]